MLFDEYFDDSDLDPKYDYPLLEKGLHSVSGYLKYWSNHNTKIIETVPEERLLILKTNDINNKTNEIADFLQISPEAFNLKQIHQNKTFKRPVDISSISQNHIQDCTNRYCLKLMKEYFPEYL